MNTKSVQCDKEVQIDLNSTIWYRCDLECPDGKKHDGLCQTTIYNAKWHDGRNVRRKNIVIQWSVQELANMEPETDETPVPPQCDYRYRTLRSQTLTRCEEPAYFNVRAQLIDELHHQHIERQLQRCSQHGTTLRELMVDNGGYTSSGLMRILSVEPIDTP